MTSPIRLLSCALVAGLSALPAAAGTTLGVAATDPAGHATFADTATTISVTFDAPVDETTVDGTTFRVYGRWSGVVPGLLSVDGGDTVVFQPLRPFFVGEQVNVMLSAGVLGSGGEGLTGGYSFGFMTRGAPGTGDFTLAAQQSTRLENEGLVQSYGIYAGDLNGDGAPDFSIPNETANDVRVFINDGCGRFSGPDIYPLPFGSTPSSNEGVDLDGDGDIDFACANIGGDSMSVFLGNGDGTYLGPTTYPSGNNARGLTVLDAEGDGDVDIVIAHRSGSSVGLHLNNGDGSFAPVSTFDGGGSGETAVQAADADNDGITDFFVGLYNSDALSLLLGDGAAGFTVSDTTPVGNGPWMIAVGDVDSDGIVDAATCNAFSDDASVVRGDGAGNLLPATNLPVGDFPLAVDLGDLNGDGDLDLVVSNLGTANWTCYSNDGSGVFSSPFNLAADGAGSCATLVDYDRDGFLDIVGVDEFDDWIFFYRQDVPSPPGVQLPRCESTMRVNNLANRGGYGTQPAHDVAVGSIFFWGISGAENDLFALALGLPLEPGLSSAFGILGLADPLAIPVIATTDAFGEANIPIPLAPSVVGGVTVGLQVFTNTADGIRLSNPEQVFLSP